MKRLWFASKRFGWGWTPITWEGWLVTVVMAFLIACSIIYATGLLRIVSVVFLILVLFFMCCKTGEWPRWRWG